MQRLLLALVLGVLTGTPLAAQEDLVPLPVITGVTTVVGAYAPGYFSTGKDVMNENLRFNFYIYVANLDAVWSSITTVRVHIGTLYWTIDKEKRGNREMGYIGGWGSWSLSDATAEITPLDLKVSIKLTDGRTVEKPFRLFPEDEATNGYRFLIPHSFVGGETPYHLRSPEAARVLRVVMEESDIVIDFTIPDRRTTSLAIHLFDDQDADMGSTEVLRVGARGPLWMNEGGILLGGGEVNHVRVPLAVFRPDGKRTAESVNLSTWATVDPQSNLHRSSYVLFQEGTKYAFSKPGSPALILHNPYRDAREQALRYPRPSPAWSDGDSKAWLLGLGGILGIINSETFDELTPMKKTPANQDKVDAMLASSWSVSSRETLIEAMQSLIDFGHRSRFAKQLQMLRDNPQASDQELAALVASAQGWPASQFEFVRRFHPLVGDRGLLAWDLCRLVMLARDGFLLGYLSEAETWTWLQTVGDRLRDAYASWVDLGDSFLVGRMYFAGPERSSELYLAGRNAMETLLRPDGLWAKTPWPPRSEAEVDYVPVGLGASR